MESVKVTFPPALETEQSFQQVLATAHELNEFGNPGDVRAYLELLRKKIASTPDVARNPDLAKAYEQVVVYLRFSALALQDDNDLAALFRLHVLYALTTDVDLKTRLELLFLMSNDDFTEQTKRRRILAAISENDETIGQRLLNIPDAPIPLPPSIRNWIIDFLRQVGTGQPLTSLEIGVYMSKSPNVRALSRQEQDLLHQVLSLYVFIINPPLSEPLQRYLRAVAETPPGTPSPTADESPTEPPAAGPPEDFRSTLLQSLFEESAMEEAVYEEEKRLLAEGEFSVARVCDQLAAAYREKNTSRVEAGLFLLARSGHWPTFLGESQTLQALVEQEILPALLPDLKAKRPSLSLRSLLDDFRRQPNRPVYIKCFIERLLGELWRGDAEKAAREAVRIVSIAFREGYTDAAAMAFFDAGTQRFRWADTGVDSQGVPILT